MGDNTTTTTTTTTTTFPFLPNLHHITDRATHDAATAKAQSTSPSPVPTVIYVSSAAKPSCVSANPKFVGLAERYPDVQFYVMEMTARTTPMIKFGPQNTPIFILMKGGWCETVLGLDVGGVEGKIRGGVEGWWWWR